MAETRVVKKHIALLLALVCFMYLSQVTIFIIHQDTWFDPSFSLETVHKMKTESIVWRSYDVNPPVYYYLLYGWMKLNPGMLEENWGRELSVLFGLLFITCAYFALREVFGKAGEYATIFLALSTTYIEYGTEIRGYSLLLMLSAAALWGIVFAKRFRSGIWISALALFLMPFVHYYAAMAVFFFVVLFYVYWCEEFGPTVWMGVGILALMGFVGTGLAYFMFARPQMGHITGIWPDTDFSIFPSALISSFVYILDASLKQLSNVGWIKFLMIISYFGIFVLIGVYSWVALKWLFTKQEVSKRKAMLMVMCVSAFFPLAVLIALMFSKVLPSYHHRYFLVVLWMFAAATYVMLVDWLMKLRAKVASVMLFCIFVMFGVLFYAFYVSANHDLQLLEKQIPCSPATVVHESPFSHAPLEVYSGEYGCGWRNVMSTNMTVKQASGMGMDAVAREDMFWNQSFPDGAFYMVHADANHTLPNRTMYTIYIGEGVSLLYVGEK